MEAHDNPYAPPGEPIADADRPAVSPTTIQKRLLGRLIDTLVYSIPQFAGIVVFVEMGNDRFSALVGFVLTSFFGMAIVVGLQALLLGTRAQTVGKLAIGTAIVDRQGHRASLLTTLMLRELPIIVMTVMPVLLPLALADGLFILGSDRRALHDNWAKTDVVDRNQARTRAKKA